MKKSEPDLTSENVLRPDVLGEFPSDPRRLILAQFGVWVLEGCAEVDAGSVARKMEGYLVSARLMRAGNIAWRVDQQGGDWVQWETARLPENLPPDGEVVFVFGMAMGIGDPFPQPSGTFALHLNGRHAVTFRFVKHTEMWQGDDARFCYQVKRVIVAPPGQALTLDTGTDRESAASYGLGLLRVPVKELSPGEPVTLRVEAQDEVPTTRWFRLDAGSVAVKGSEDYGTLSESNYWQGLLEVAGRTGRPKAGRYQVFFGDLHVHSGSIDYPEQPGGCGMGTPEENYRYARDVSNLDFFALSEHDWQMPGGRGWELRQELAERFNQGERFVTLLSYEWGRCYGQRCVCYESGDAPLYSSLEGVTKPTDLWDRLRRLPGRAITIPHHPAWTKSPLDLNYYDPQFDRLIEVYSCWGNFEYDGAVEPGSFDRFEGRCLRDVLGLGYRMGVVASSDGHDGHAGDAQGMRSKHPQLYHYLGSGRVAVLAEELTRQSVFDALYCRRTYGTTGEPIAMDFRVNGVIMGGEIPEGDLKEAPEICVEATGTTRLVRIVIIRDGRVAHVRMCDSPSERVVWRDQEYGSAGYYYARIEQEDGEMAWSSPVWVNLRDTSAE